MMLQKLNQYRQQFSFPMVKVGKAQKKNSKATQYAFEWVENLKQLQEVQRFRAQQFSKQFGIEFESGLDQDLYDFGCEHAVLRDKSTGEIVAYTRLKLWQGHELANSYSAHEFKIIDELGHLSNIVEMGRTCVHPRYRSGKTLSILWLNLVPKVLWEMRAKHMIGCVSICLEGNEARAYHTHQAIQQLAENQRCDIQSQQPFEPSCPSHSFSQDERIPKLFDVYLKMNAKLSEQAFYDREFNCLDYFVLLDVKQMAKHFIRQKKVKAS